MEMITARVGQWRRRGADVELLSAAETARLTGSQRYVGGWIDRRGGTVQPLSYVRGLARAARGAGARIFSQSPATDLEELEREWRIQTPGGAVASEIVILATDVGPDASLGVHETAVRNAVMAAAGAPASSQLRIAREPVLVSAA